jgi:hypothetical protein
MAELIVLSIGVILYGFFYEINRTNRLTYLWRREYIARISENNMSNSIVYYDHLGNPNILSIAQLSNRVVQEIPLPDYTNIIDKHTKQDIAKSDMGYCPISLDPIKKNDKIRTLICGHKFLLNPIDLWLKNNLECPLCRHKFNKNLEN